MRVLILDDDQMAFALTESLLRQSIPGVTVLHANEENAFCNLLDNLTTIPEQLPDLILLELHMPGFDAYEMLGWLRGITTTRKIPVAFLTRSKNPKNYLFASRLNTPLFIKGERLVEQVKAIENMLAWCRGHAHANASYISIF